MLPLLVAIKEEKKTFSDGMRIEGAYLKNIGVNIDEVSISNGDGGSDFGKICEAIYKAQ